jgi:hypothetical protein
MTQPTENLAPLGAAPVRESAGKANRGRVIDAKQFQTRVQKIGELLQNLDRTADPATRTCAKDLVQLVMDLHGIGVERIIDITFDSGENGAKILDQLAEDPVVSGLLILHNLHPDDLPTRVAKKLKQIDSALHKMGAEARLLAADDGVRLYVTVNGHSCGSTKQTVQALVEEAMYEAAPDLTSLHIEGLEQPPPSTFVGVEQLLGSSQRSETIHTEGMD